MVNDMKGLVFTGVLACCCALGVGSISWAVANGLKDEQPVQTVQCFDTASEETVYYLDHIERVEGQYDTWSFVIKDGIVSYVQPSGVVCTISKSVNALENGTEVID